MSYASADRFRTIRESRMSRPDSAFDAGPPTIHLGPGVAPPSPPELAILQPPAAGRYRPRRFHARGGVGELFLATDEELERDVALKRMQDEPAGDPVGRERFFREARITGRLQHPGIVPVYGLGHDACGRPCYAMRFIDGESLSEAIRRHHAHADASDGSPPLGLRQLLQRFVAACNAIAYAHSRGVIHRDLKPQNIMLGRYGETVVVDWGLARSELTEPSVSNSMHPGPPNSSRLGSDCGNPATWIDGKEPTGAEESADVLGSETLLGCAIAGTPAYMSPEQAAGNWDQVGPASDVYSLGATLFVLLTGRLPFEGDNAADVLADVLAVPGPSPRSVRPDVPPALDAICTTAMAYLPEERYASALDLAADIERWLADEPVSVYTDDWQGRLRRWGRRHPAIVGAASAAAIILFGCMTAATIWLSDARQREQHLRESAQRHEIAAHRERDQAARQRDQAAASFRLARNAVNQILSDPGLFALRELPQVEPVRLKLLQKALKFHQAFLQQAGDDPAVREESAEAHFEVADVYRQLGRFEEAVKEYEIARDCFLELSKAFPDVARHRISLAKLFNNLSLAHSDLGRNVEAEDAIRQSLAYGEALLLAQPGNRDIRTGLAKNYHNLGNIERNVKRFADAEKSFVRSLELGNELIRESPSDPHSRLDQGKHHHVMAALLLETNRADDAEPHVRSAIDFTEALVRDFPGSPEFRRALVGVYVTQARLYSSRGDSGPMEEMLRKALGVTERLAADYPYVPDYLQFRVEICGLLAKLLHEQKRKNELAEILLRESQAREACIAAQPNNVVAAVAHGAAICNHGVTLAEFDDLENAAAQYTAAIRVLEAARAKSPNDPRIRQFLRNCYGNRALMHKSKREPQHALDDWRQAIELTTNDLDRAELRLHTAWSLLLLEKYLDAAEAACLASEVANLPAVSAVSAATTLAYAAGRAAHDDTLAAEDRARRAKIFADRAILLLINCKFDPYLKSADTLKHLKTDKSFDSIRERAEFRELVAEQK
jgi:serine/threonine-protein kinase